MKKMIKVSCEVLPLNSEDHMEFKEYEVEMDGEITVLNVLEHIYQMLDGDVAFYSFCRQGLCGGCMVEMNGKRVLACKTLALEKMKIKPIVDTKEV